MLRYGAAPGAGANGAAPGAAAAGEYGHHPHAGGYGYEGAYVKGQTTPPHDPASATAAYHHASPSSPANARGNAAPGAANRASLSQRVPASAPAHTSSHPPGVQGAGAGGYYGGAYPYYGVQGEYPATAYPGAQSQAAQQGQGQSAAQGQQAGQGQQGQGWPSGAMQQQQGRSVSSGSAGYGAHPQHQGQQAQGQQQQQQQQQAQHQQHHQAHPQHHAAGGAHAQLGAHGYAAQQPAWQGYAYGAYGYPHYQQQGAYGYAQSDGHAATPTTAGGAHWSTAWPGGGAAGADARYGPQSAGIMPGYTRDAAGNPVAAYGAHMMQGTLPGHDAALGGAAVGADYGGLGKRSSMEDTMDPAAGKKRKGVKGKPEELALPPPGPVEPPAQEKSHLHPPPQARSAWQIFFADRLNEAKANVQPGDKLNVAHVAKDAGSAYAQLAGPEKEYYAKKAQEARDQYAIDLAAWQATLTPEDVRIENAFRANQRKAGKSRKGNLKDPNAPKKPLSAYFLFLKAIRSSPHLTEQVFEGEVETTKQSMLAAKRWRGFSDEEKKPYLKQAELDKAEYDNLRKEYEDDAAARARGETVPDKPHVEPSYARDQVSPRLLAAVLPHLYDENAPTILDADVKPKGPARDEKPVAEAGQGDSGAAIATDTKEEHGVSPEDSKADETMDESSDNILHNLGLPEGLDFAAGFDLNNGHGDGAFDFNPAETPAHDEPADAGPKVEEAKPEDMQALQSSSAADNENSVQTMGYTNVHQDGNSSFVESVMVSSNIPDLLPKAEESQPAVIEPREGGDAAEPAVDPPQVEELPEASVMQPADASETAPTGDAAAEQQDSAVVAEDSGLPNVGSSEQPPAAAAHEKRSRSPTPDAEKIEAAQDMGVTTEEVLAHPDEVIPETAPPEVTDPAEAAQSGAGPTETPADATEPAADN